MRRTASSMLVVTVALAAAAAVGRAQPATETIAPPEAGPGAAADDMGYALGFRIGGQILAEQKEMGSAIDRAALARGLADAVTGAQPQLDEPRFKRAVAAIDAFMARRQQEFLQRMEAAARRNLEKGNEFLRANAKRKGVVTLPSGLQYEVLEQGAGPQPGLDHVVVAHYRGTRINGEEFDGTDPKGEPASFPLRGVVPGWQEALPLMKAGATWRIYVPPALGYGEQGSPPTIEPNEVLVFEISLISSRPAPAR